MELSQMATIKLIAQKAGVSTATVSYVINNTGNVSEETRNKVLKVIEKYNYRPNRIAKSLRVNRTNTIGVIVEDITVFHVPWIINGINEYAEKNGYHLILSDLRLLDKIKNRFEELSNYKDEINEAIDIILSSKVDGIIYIAMHDRKIDGIFKNVDLPVVYTYCYTDNENDLSVTYENQGISYEATKYLINQGHKKIAVISGPINSMPSHKRMLGFQTALMESGLELKQEYIKIGDWEYEFGYNMCIELMELSNPPTAIFAMNDKMALGVLNAACSINIKVPKELSIIGFDNTESSYYSNPKLTTIALPLKEMGYTAASYIDKKLKGEIIENNSVILPCKLLKRESVAKI
jgi:LacI family transcriptional regulator